ncbi:hydrolase [Flavobacteriaceae bacterium S0825]|uniref:hydrolase n=1 Tax=Gaetbulibacter sp. S0825 TaxID=2720084 RepID=UPI001431C6E1|nr:hydrolase [Gaetbulibacter sp. S0825]MCK0109652.1 hydrolase [Flavobacteriaceae bacterium S0825]NIX65285.1 hydrolase [Gaetbulibacter sp. S0825]
MKSKIYLYLFVFTLLLVLFMYVNSKSILEKYEKDITTAKERIEIYKDSLTVLQDENYDLMYFNLEHNEDAITYFEKEGIDVTTLIPFLKDELYKLNEAKGEHPLVPYVAMTNGKMMINNIKFLNHKWIIADFSDGKYWGELFLTYEITKDKQLTYRLVEHFLYPPQSY